MPSAGTTRRSPSCTSPRKVRPPPAASRSSALFTASCAPGLAVLVWRCVVSSLGGGEGPSASLSFEKTPLPVVIAWGIVVRPLPCSPGCRCSFQGAASARRGG